MKVQKFVEIAYRKVATRDEYGDENWQALNKEIDRIMAKLATTEPELLNTEWFRLRDYRKSKTPMWTLDPLVDALSDGLRERFGTYYQKRKARPSVHDSPAIGRMTGTEFEIYIAEMLKSVGITDISGTPASGDQGADLLFTWNRKKIAVQVKRYKGSVGNEAVQEVHAARGFYGCDAAWVVTNAQFTSSAIALAGTLGVVLVSGDDLSNFGSFARRQFGSTG